MSTENSVENNQSSEQVKEASKENKATPEKQTKDYLKIVDDAYVASTGAGNWSQKVLDLLGEHKSPVLFGLILSGVLSLFDYPFLAKTTVVIVGLIVVSKILFSKQKVRGVANKVIEEGIDKTKSMINKKQKEETKTEVK